MANTVFGLKGTIATKSAVQSVASSATAAIVTFDLETYDTSGDTEAVKFHSITTNTGRFYAVEDGFYELSATVKFAAIAAAGRVALGYSIDAGADVETVEQVTSATSSTPGLFMKKYLKLSAGQYVTLKALQTSGGAIDIVVAGTEAVFKKM